MENRNIVIFGIIVLLVLILSDSSLTGRGIDNVVVVTIGMANYNGDDLQDIKISNWPSKGCVTYFINNGFGIYTIKTSKGFKCYVK